MSDPLNIEEITEQALQEATPQDPSGGTGLLSPEVTKQLNGVINDRRRAAGLETFSNFDSPGPHGFNRRPFIFTRVGERERGEIIYAALNPDECRINLRTRAVLEKTGGGEVQHVARFNPDRADRLGRFLDEIPISYSLNTGNCLPLRFADGSIKIPPGLNTIYALQQLLLDSDHILPDGRPNDLIIIQNTMQYPELILEGKVDPEGMNFSSTAESPNSIQGISFSVSVHTTIPKLVSYEALVGMWVTHAPNIGKR